MIRKLGASLQRTLALLLLTALAASAQAAVMAEYAVKSALLFRLPQFVYQAGSNREQPLTLCLLGSNPFDGALEKLAQSPIDGRAVRYQKLSGTPEAVNCDFVFISRSESVYLDGVLRRLSAYPAVTVSDIDGFAKAGGMVEFATGDDGAAISILINRKAAQKQSVEFKAQLLRLAKVVEP